MSSPRLTLFVCEDFAQSQTLRKDIDIESFLGNVIVAQLQLEGASEGMGKWERKKEKKGGRRGDCCLCVQRNCVTQSPQSQSQMISSNPVISHNPKFNQALTQYHTASSILKFKEHKFGSMKPKDATSDFITQFIFFTYQNNNLNGKLQEIVYMYIHR